MANRPVSIDLQAKLVGEFKTLNQWVNHASRVFAGYDKRKTPFLCVDNDGFVCSIGLDFMESDFHKRFPVKAYVLIRSALTMPEAKPTLEGLFNVEP